ncbi:ATP-binding protein [Streptomyces sp. NPDC048650]|uniref:ATP-binding protein n=1 Tax=Streptomyces sp. NPDC048650 TaxID=3365583 RepID=UPI00371564E1
MSTRARPAAIRPTLTPSPAAAYRIPSDARSVGWARRELRRQLRIWGIDAELSYTATLLLSELVTNAVRAQAARTPAAPTVGIRFAFSDGRLRLEVRDASDEQPVQYATQEDEECGRGLVLVDVLADGWGVTRHATGKTVWAELAVTGAVSVRRPDEPPRP